MGGRQSQPAEEQPPSLDILDAGARMNQLAQEARGAEKQEKVDSFDCFETFSGLWLPQAPA